VKVKKSERLKRVKGQKVWKAKRCESVGSRRIYGTTVVKLKMWLS
jgi:hypothetical protein